MTIQKSTRLGLKTYSDGADPHPNRAEFNEMVSTIDSQAAIVLPSAPTSSRPTAGVFGRFFPDSTTGRLYFDNGTAWQEVTVNGGGGWGTTIVVNSMGAEGTSSRSARADHVHNIPLATTTAHGAMPMADRAALDAATSSPQASTLVKRDANGRLQASAPNAPEDVATQSYIDSKTWDATAIVSGMIARERLPLATDGSPGAVSAGQSYLINHSSPTPDAKALVKRDSAGLFDVATPTADTHPSSKRYVDDKIAGHKHAGSDITSSVPWAYITGSTSAWNLTDNGGRAWSTVAVTDQGRFFRYSSTRRHKTNIRNFGEVLEDVLSLQPVTYDYKPEHGGLQDQVGLIAEDVVEIFPEVVQIDESGRPEGINYQMIVPHLIAAIQELSDRVVELQNRVGTLEDGS